MFMNITPCKFFSVSTLNQRTDPLKSEEIRHPKPNNLSKNHGIEEDSEKKTDNERQLKRCQGFVHKFSMLKDEKREKQRENKIKTFWLMS